VVRHIYIYIYVIRRQSVDRLYLTCGWAGIEYQLAMGWRVQGSNPGGGEIFHTHPDWPWGPSASCKWVPDLFLRRQAAGTSCEPPTLI
jgi:hypothetical protein